MFLEVLYEKHGFDKSMSNGNIYGFVKVKLIVKSYLKPVVIT